MTIAVCRVTLRISESHSLKEKRQIVRSVLSRVRERFPVSAAEVDHLDAWQTAALGFACVSSDERTANEVISAVVSFIERNPAGAEVLAIETELVHAL